MTGTTALAQATSDAQPQSIGSTPDYNADIVVTANRRSQSLTDVGLAMSVLDSSLLETRQVSSVNNLAALVPGLSIGNSGYATPIYSLRGVGVNEPTVGAGSGVTVYVDEVPLTLPIFTRGASFDRERVEVVKGPQGTLYGQNATGGAINYIAAKPTDSFQASVRGSYGRFNTATLEGLVSAPPLSDTLKGRTAARGERGSGWQKALRVTTAWQGSQIRWPRDAGMGTWRRLSCLAQCQWLELSVEERAIADYCVKLTEQPGRMEAADIQALRDAGLSDARIYYVIELASAFNLTNRMTSGYGMRPDDDFMAAIAPVT